jgi:hypothetical protein
MLKRSNHEILERTFGQASGGVFHLDEGLLIVMKRQTIINIQNKTHWLV